MAYRGTGGRFVLVMVVMVVGIFFFAEALTLQTHAEGKYRDRFKPDKEDNVSRIIDHSGGLLAEPMKAKAGQFPCQVLLITTKPDNKGVDTAYLCGGSIIYLDWIMTAAHCLADGIYKQGAPNGHKVTAKRLRIYAGLTKKSDRDSDPNVQKNEYDTKEIMYTGNDKLIFVHEEYNDRIKYSSDIAIIKLKNHLQISKYVEPISLATEEDNIPNSLLMVSGWGRISFLIPDPIVDLRYATGLKLIDPSQCKAHYISYNEDTMICYDGTNKIDAKGDSGGAVATKIGNVHVQVGIVSWTKYREYQGVATKVSEFRPWIVDITGVRLVDECPVNPGDLRSADTLNINTCRYGECINGRCTCYPGYMGPSCDERETVCPEDRGFFSPTGSKQCFKLFQSEVTWEQAKQTCTAHGLFLAHPWDAVGLRSYIVQRYGEDKWYWLGAREDDSETYRWADNRKSISPSNPLWYTFDPAHVQPQSGPNGCLTLLGHYSYWKKAPDQVFWDSPCSTKNKPLCEFFPAVPAVGCNDCQHGDCYNIVCLCHDGYTGIHCSEKETAEKIQYEEGNQYEEIWNDKGAHKEQDVSIWRSTNLSPDYCSLGDFAHRGHSRPTILSISVADNPPAVVHPTSFNKLWDDAGSGADWDLVVYSMNAPLGYTCIGDVAMRWHTHRPEKKHYCCIQDELLVNGELVLIYKDTGSGRMRPLSLWRAVSGSDTNGISGNNFLAVHGHDEPLHAKVLNSQKAITAPCPDSFFKSEGSNKCFKLLSDETKVSWDKAVEKCKNAGLKLAEPSDAVAVTLRKDLISRYGLDEAWVWLNARPNSAGKYMWQRGGTELRADNSLWYGSHPVGRVTTGYHLCIPTWSSRVSSHPEQPYYSCSSVGSAGYYPLCEK